MKSRHRPTSSILCLVVIFSPALLAGDLNERFELTLDRVLKGGPPVYNDSLVLADAVPQHVRRFTEFSGDVSGRYIGALATAARFRGGSFPELDRIVGKVVALQKADGHFGDPFGTGEIANSDMALLWGNGRLLIGLLEYHRLKPTPAAAQPRLCNFAARHPRTLLHHSRRTVPHRLIGSGFGSGYIRHFRNHEMGNQFVQSEVHGAGVVPISL